jgi:cbb3-type cytochrome oxidase subunit 3
MELLLWFSKPEHTKPLALIIFLLTFVGIVFYVYGNRGRGERLEAWRYLPFLDDESLTPASNDSNLPDPKKPHQDAKD